MTQKKIGEIWIGILWYLMFLFKYIYNTKSILATLESVFFYLKSIRKLSLSFIHSFLSYLLYKIDSTSIDCHV